MRKQKRVTAKQLEDELNELYTPEEALEVGAYMAEAKRLLKHGLYGTALRKYDPIAFELALQDANGNQ